MTASEIIRKFTDSHCIRVSGKRYEPAVFLRVGKEIYSYGKSWGIMEREDITLESLERHLEAMIDEGLKVEFI